VESPRLPMNCLQNGFVRENIGCAVCDLTVHSIVLKQADHSSVSMAACLKSGSCLFPYTNIHNFIVQHFGTKSLV
jgi:hypothetical protein